MDPYKIKKYSENHKDEITRIFNYYVENEFAAFDQKPVESTLLNGIIMESNLPGFVIEFNCKIVGFGFAYKYHNSASFDKTVKLSYFIEKEHTNKGLGIELLKRLEIVCKNLNIENILVHISSLNEPSLKFHKKYGFKECGRFSKIGSKFGKLFDDVWMQKEI